MIDVSDVVANKAREVGSEWWLSTLDELVASVAEDWGLAIGRTLPGGTEAVVAEVERADGSAAVLKLLVPRPTGTGLDNRAAHHEATVLALARGRGCAELFAADPARGALLMERLGPPLCDLGLDFGQRQAIMVACALDLWRPVPDADLPTGADKAEWLIEFVETMWHRLGQPCSKRTIRHAIGCGEQRKSDFDRERALLVHGDIHQWNTLRAGDGFKLVDPDGLVAEPEYDLGILMREDPVELMAGDPFERADTLAATTGLDATAIWEWGVIERVSTGLLCTSIGLQPIGSEMLSAAEAIAAR